MANKQARQSESTSPRPKRHLLKGAAPHREPTLASRVTKLTPQAKPATPLDRTSILRLLSKAFIEATDSCVIVDKGGQVVALNNETERAYGWSSAELTGRPLQTIMPPEWRALCGERIRSCLRGEAVRNVESERWNKAGQRVPVLSTYSLLRDQKGRATAIAVLTKDITELRRVEVDLKRNQQELRELSSRLLTAAEEEGKKIARELHDSFGPRLARLNLRVSNVAGRLHFEPEIASELAAIEAELSELAKSVHDLSRLLHPAALSQLGLEAALEAECATFSRLRGITVKFSAENVPDSLSDAIAFCLYRVAQEALQNIRKHAEAKTASVTLSRTAQGIVMVIRDSGKGFDINAARGKGGVGLVSMEERVRMAKGSILVNSKAGEGTQVEVCVPMVG